MKENLKTIANISSKVLLKWVFIVVMGFFATGLTFTMVLYRNFKLISTGITVAFLELYKTNLSAFLLFFGAPIFMILYVVIANKLSIQSAIHLLWKGKTGDYLLSKVKTIIARLLEKEGWRKSFSDKAILKAKVLQEIKNDPDTSRLQRNVIGFVLARIQLDKVDFQQEDLKISDIIVTKFSDFVTEIIEPSLVMFWVLFSVQLFLLMISEVF